MRSILALFLTALAVGLAPAAYADPPDPSWIEGFWDDDDFDIVVVSIASTSAVLVAVVVAGEPVWIRLADVEPSNPNVGPAPLRTAGRPRAPPVDPLPLA